jgi:hypothetical protein
MTNQSDPPGCASDACEREFIRREFGGHFGQPAHLAASIVLRTAIGTGEEPTEAAAGGAES